MKYTHKVKYYETDKMGVTHHSNYIRWMEEARIEFLDKIGFSYYKLEEDGIMSPVIGIECDYKATTTFDDEVEIEVKNCSRFTFCGCKNLKKAVFDSAKQVQGNDSFALTYTKGDGIPMSYPNLQSGWGMFSNALLKAKHVISFLNSIPSWNNNTTHNLTVGIHIDHQTDEDVLTAISNAETKGWTMTVQWNGTPTASTATSYSLRKPMIYAKIINTQSPEEYFKQKLDWGHYVTNWEENGYQEFSSLEEAYEYFGIEPEL